MTIVRTVPPVHARHGEGFEAMRIGPELFGKEGDPFLNVDHFRMRTPTFPPHPHAGFSAVTYVLPESPGAMLNRDGRGDRSIIAPGGVHWTAAGRGLVHEEVPEPPGVLVDGLQIFIRQPVEQEQSDAVIHHVDSPDVPMVEIGEGSSVRIVAGSFGQLRAPFLPPSPLQILDITLAPGAAMSWTAPWAGGTATLYLFSGGLDIDGAEVAAPSLTVFARGTPSVRLGATIGDARCVLFTGQPLDQPSISSGPFVLSSSDALEAAFMRYRRGEMGRITD